MKKPKYSFYPIKTHLFNTFQDLAADPGSRSLGFRRAMCRVFPVAPAGDLWYTVLSAGGGSRLWRSAACAAQCKSGGVFMKKVTIFLDKIPHHTVSFTPPPPHGC
jgi:hypothetical protein